MSDNKTKAIELIDMVFSDTSVDPDTTYEDLCDLADECLERIQCLVDDGVDDVREKCPW